MEEREKEQVQEVLHNLRQLQGPEDKKQLEAAPVSHKRPYTKLCSAPEKLQAPCICSLVLHSPKEFDCLQNHTQLGPRSFATEIGICRD